MPTPGCDNAGADYPAKVYQRDLVVDFQAAYAETEKPRFISFPARAWRYEKVFMKKWGRNVFFHTVEKNHLHFPHSVKNMIGGKATRRCSGRIQHYYTNQAEIYKMMLDRWLTKHCTVELDGVWLDFCSPISKTLARSLSTLAPRLRRDQPVPICVSVKGAQEPAGWNYFTGRGHEMRSQWLGGYLAAHYDGKWEHHRTNIYQTLGKVPMVTAMGILYPRR